MVKKIVNVKQHQRKVPSGGKTTVRRHTRRIENKKKEKIIYLNPVSEYKNVCIKCGMKNSLYPRWEGKKRYYYCESCYQPSQGVTEREYKKMMENKKIDFIFESYLADAKDKLAEQYKFRRGNQIEWTWIVRYLQEVNKSDNKEEYLFQKIKELESKGDNKDKEDIILLNLSKRIKIEIEQMS